MLAWWMLVPTLLAMMVALVLPGFMWLRAGSRSSLVAIGAAPAFTFGLITFLSVAYPAFGIEWEPSTVMPVLGLSSLGGALTWALSYFHRTNGGFALNGVPFRQALGAGHHPFRRPGFSVRTRRPARGIDGGSTLRLGLKTQKTYPLTIGSRGLSAIYKRDAVNAGRSSAACRCRETANPT